MKVVAVFWDLDNTHLSILNHYGHQDNYLSELIDKVFDLYKGHQIRIFRAYADYEKIIKVQSAIQKKGVTPKHVFSSNSGSDNRKNASDIELSLDALEIAITYKDIDEFVIISADSDMIPLIRRLTYYGKTTHLIYLDIAIAEDKLVLDFANESTRIEDLIKLKKKDPDELTIEELKQGALAAVEIVEKFYERNKEKPELFVGVPIFKGEMIQKKGYSGKVAEKILEYCLENGILDSEDLGGNRIKITVKTPVHS
jgi:uncharacterized LabA/DUF88 family protein